MVVGRNGNVQAPGLCSGRGNAPNTATQNDTSSNNYYHYYITRTLYGVQRAPQTEWQFVCVCVCVCLVVWRREKATAAFSPAFSPVLPPKARDRSAFALGANPITASDSRSPLLQQVAQRMSQGGVGGQAGMNSMHLRLGRRRRWDDPI